MAIYYKIALHSTFKVTMTTIAEARQRIIDVLISAPHSGVLGAYLGEQLKKAGIHASEHGKLREFIRINVPEVCEAGMHGLDVLFRLISVQSGKSVDSIAGPEKGLGIDDPAVWRTFSSPGGLYRLFGHQDGHLLVVSPRELPPGLPWLHIPPCSESNHHSIATSWVSGLGEPSEFLRGALMSGSGPSSAFLVAVREKGLASEWSQFRIAKIREFFESSLREKTIPLNAKLTSTAKPKAEITVKSLPQSAVSLPLDPSRFREVILAAVQRMSDDELRKLPIPAGYIVDSLEKRHFGS